MLFGMFPKKEAFPTKRGRAPSGGRFCCPYLHTFHLQCPFFGLVTILELSSLQYKPPNKGNNVTKYEYLPTIEDAMGPIVMTLVIVCWPDASAADGIEQSAMCENPPLPRDYNPPPSSCYLV